MKKFLIKFKNSKLSNKMVLIYTVIFGIVCTIALFALQITLNIYDEQIYEKSLQELHFFSKKVDDELEKVEEFSYELALDYTIQKQLSEIYELEDLNMYSFEMSKLRSRLSTEIINTQLILGMIYTDKKLTTYEIGNGYIPIPIEIYEEIVKKLDEAGGAYVYDEPTQDFPYLVSGRNIRKHLDASLKYLGSLIFVSDLSDFIERNRNIIGMPTSSLCVYSEQGLIYESEEGVFEKLPNLIQNKEHNIRNINGKKYFICQLKSAKTGWIYTNMVPYSDIYLLNSIVRYSLLIGMGGLFIISILISNKLASIITQPLNQLIECIKIIETGDFIKARNYLKDNEQMDEIGILKQEFKNMLEKIIDLIHENYEKQLLIKDTEYKALQAQINPHFLYNTLNSIHWMIRAKRNEEASKMLISLSDLLRASLRKNPCSTIKEEINMIENYINIQKVRYQSRAKFNIRVIDGLEEYLIPHMIIQPLVENAINHGVDNSLNECYILVEIRENEKKNKIIIEIEDNGAGMTPQQLRDISVFTINRKVNGIGIQNIVERLNLFFCEEIIFHINSTLGIGTKVYIEIPKIMGE